ncbi:halocyanin domain-containing protein [Haloarchaeobius iranensis]|uniref:Halocyanin domain-containing protein n=1 Tax=Haloarchaeobius iranensis TaxID=996166 RepID=A0A1G9TMR6_9EURY|nr:halocyanin domain-containing protein [Haloarchaeobius iranensis]SDM48973.1 halocyanin domain-containing protein [Haloarchaeobius iranensis]
MSRDTRLDRRTFVKTTAAVTALSAVAGCLGGSDGPSDGGDDGGDETSGGGGGGDDSNGGGGGTDFGGWFDNVGNFDAVADHTGESEVTVTVGAQGNGGAFAFSPPAIRVDSGTTVVWEWTGDGGSHNVVAEGGSFESDLVGSPGHTFEHAFDSSETFKYVCTPHERMGMKGAVVVE